MHMFVQLFFIISSTVHSVSTTVLFPQALPVSPVKTKTIATSQARSLTL